MRQLKTGIMAGREIRSGEKWYGNKVRGLLQLMNADYAVPTFYVIDSLTPGLNEENGKLELMLEQWKAGKDFEPEQLWVVRSSTVLEDSGRESWAGLFHSELNVRTEALAAAIRKVLASYKGAGGGIIIQEQVAADYSGVIFSKDPLEPSADTVLLTLTEGTGEKLVAGEKEGLTLHIRNGCPDYGGQEITLEKDTEDILKELARMTLKLEKKLHTPVDVEFCFTDRQIRWLQVRPVTTLDKKPVFIWDNANIGENFPGLSLPLTISYVRHTYALAYEGLASFVGMPASRIRKNGDLFRSMVGGINGALYYNVTAWQMLLAQLPFRRKTTGRLTRIWDMKAVGQTFEEKRISPVIYLRLLFNLLLALLLFRRRERLFREHFRSVYDRLDPLDFSRLTSAELKQAFEQLEDKLARNWIIPVLNGLLLMLFYGRLERLIGRGRPAQLHPGLLNEVIAGYRNVKSAELIEAYFDLLALIQQDEAVSGLFRDLTPERIYSDLEMKHPVTFSQILSYLRNYGERIDGGELKIETVNYREDPLRFILHLKENLDATVPERNGGRRAFDQRKMLKEIYGWRLGQRLRAGFYIRQTARLVSNREDHRFFRLKGYHLIRRIFRAIDGHLVADGFLENRGDSLYLSYKDLLDQGADQRLKEVVREQKEQYHRFEKAKIIHRYLQTGDVFEPDEHSAEATEQEIAKGLGCSRGVAGAEVIHYDRAAYTYDDYKGKIVVARYIEPVGVSQVSGAAGIILERGNLLSHTAILCRELGIPSIVGARNAMSILGNGEKIIMNGATGTITREHEK